MNLKIITNPLSLEIHGFSGTALNKDYAGTAFKLMDKMWQVVNANGLPHKGKNIWVYESNGKIFAGVELRDVPKDGIGLEQKSVVLKKYAY
jgi:hypothetical protein